MGLVLTTRRATLALATRATGLVLSSRRTTLGLFLRPREAGIGDVLAELLALIEVVQDGGTYHPTEARQELLSLAEAVMARLAAAPQSISDAVSVAEQVADALGHSNGAVDLLAETLGLGESVSVLLDLRSALTEAIGVVEAGGSSAGMREAAQEAIGVAESALSAAGSVEVRQEAVSAVESALAALAGHEVASEVVGVTELRTSLLALHEQLAATLAVVESEADVYTPAQTATPAIVSPAEGASVGLAPVIVVSTVSGATVELFVDGVSAGTATASGTTASFNPAVSAGAHTLTATATAAGLPVSSLSAAVHITAADAALATGARLARVVGLRAAMGSRYILPQYAGTELAMPMANAGDSALGVYPDTWLSDFGVYGGYWGTNNRGRKAIDWWAATVGQYPGGTGWRAYEPVTNVLPADVMPKASCFQPGSGGADVPGHANPTLTSLPFLIGCAAQVFDSGATSLYATYKTTWKTGLDLLPRNASGCIDIGTGWDICEEGYYDAHVTNGQVSTASATVGWSYKELGRMATAQGDTATASACTDAVNAIILGLRSQLRRADGLYDLSSAERLPCISSTAIIVKWGLCSPAEAAVSATALRDAIQNDPHNSCRGWMRHLSYGNVACDEPAWLPSHDYSATPVGTLVRNGPNKNLYRLKTPGVSASGSGPLTTVNDTTLATSSDIMDGTCVWTYWPGNAWSHVWGGSPAGEYINGGYWAMPWNKWLADAIEVADASMAQNLRQSIVREYLRQHRIDKGANWDFMQDPRWLPGAHPWVGAGGPATGIADNLYRNQTLYAQSNGALIGVTDDTADTAVVLDGTESPTPWQKTILVPQGHQTYGVSLSANATVTIYEAEQNNNTLAETIPPPAPTYGAENTVLTHTRTGAGDASKLTGAMSKKTMGGYLRIVVSGASSAVTVTLKQGKAPGATLATPTVTATHSDAFTSSAGAPFADDYTTNNIAANYDAIGGATTWAVSGGQLSTTPANAWPMLSPKTSVMPAFADGSIAIDFVMSGTGVNTMPRVDLRGTGAISTGWNSCVSAYLSTGGAALFFTLFQFDASHNYSEAATLEITGSVVAGAAYTMKLVAVGTAVSGTIINRSTGAVVASLSGTTTVTGSGRATLGVNAQTAPNQSIAFDNLEVTPLSTIDSTKYDVIAGSWYRSATELFGNTSSGQLLLVKQATLADAANLRIAIEFKEGAGARPSLILRRSATNKYLRAQIAGTTLAITQANSGSETNLKTLTVPALTAGVWYRLLCCAYGSYAYVALVDRDKQLIVGCTYIGVAVTTAGRMGIWGGGGLQEMDNLIVEVAGALPTPVQPIPPGFAVAPYAPSSGKSALALIADDSLNETTLVHPFMLLDETGTPVATSEWPATLVSPRW